MVELVTTMLAEYSGPNTWMLIDDVSNMDASVAAVHLYAQYDLYDQLDPLLAQHARATQNSYGVMKSAGTATVYYRVRATVKSGAQDTSSGQTTRRLDGLVRTFQTLGVTHMVGLVFGDDLWLLFKRATPPLLKDIYDAQALYGFATKAVYCQDVCQTDFLASSFVPDVEGGYAMVPLIGRLLAKLFWTTKAVPQRQWGSYVSQVASAFLPRFVGFRFMEAWLLWHVHMPVNQEYKDAVPDRKVVPAHHCALRWEDFIFRRYGLSLPSESDIAQIHQCRYGYTYVLSNEWARHVMQHDLADPADRTPILM